MIWISIEQNFTNCALIAWTEAFDKYHTLIVWETNSAGSSLAVAEALTGDRNNSPNVTIKKLN